MFQQHNVLSIRLRCKINLINQPFMASVWPRNLLFDTLPNEAFYVTNFKESLSKGGNGESHRVAVGCSFQFVAEGM